MDQSTKIFSLKFKPQTPLWHILKNSTKNQPFFLIHLTVNHPQDLIGNSPYHLICSSFDVSLENLVLNQLTIPQLICFFILFIWLYAQYCINILGKIPSWSLTEVLRVNAFFLVLLQGEGEFIPESQDHVVCFIINLENYMFY